MEFADTQRVVVTGIGIISPIGSGIEPFAQAVARGVSGAGPITAFDCTRNKSKIACEVRGFDPTQFVDPKTARRTSRFIQMAVAAAQMAHTDAGLEDRPYDEVGVYIGTGAGGFDAVQEGYEKFQKLGPRGSSPFAVTNIIPNMAASNVSIHLKLHGPCVAPVAACASGLYGLTDAYQAIRHGIISGGFAGGTESTLTSFVQSGYEALRVLSTNNDHPQEASRPFDVQRDGFVIGEGAGVLYLESLASARQRGVKIYGEITACITSCDAAHITSPDTSGERIAETMRRCMAQSGVDSSRVAYVNAHGTSTQTNDDVEGRCIERAFADSTDRVMPVTALKSMIGHTLGASGALALAASLASLKTRMIPPTLNTRELDPGITGMRVVQEPEAFAVGTDHVMTNAFGFGGHNACVMVKAIDESHG